MKTSKFNKSNIMKYAHECYAVRKRNGVSFGECLKQSWGQAKWEVAAKERIEREQKEIQERHERMWAERRIKAQNENELINAECKSLGVDFHTYTMMNYYNRPCGTYYGD